MKTYIGNVGTVVRLDVGQDITAATLLQIEALKPDDTVVTWAGTARDTTKVEHIVAAGELNMAGDWYLQVKVWFGSNFWYGESARLKVYERFH